MSSAVDPNAPSPSMWAATERFPLTGVRRAATPLPGDLSTVPFGLTRVVPIESAPRPTFDESLITYDPQTQMSRLDDGPVFLLSKADTWCWENTREDGQRMSDNIRDDSIEE